MIFSVRRTTLFPAIAGAGKWLRVRCNEQSMGSTRDSDPHINPSDFARNAPSATSPQAVEEHGDVVMRWLETPLRAPAKQRRRPPPRSSRRLADGESASGRGVVMFRNSVAPLCSYECRSRRRIAKRVRLRGGGVCCHRVFLERGELLRGRRRPGPSVRGSEEESAVSRCASVVWR